MLKTVKLPILSATCDGIATLDHLQLTASFATLDARVADAAANEASIGHRRGSTGYLQFAPVPELELDLTPLSPRTQSGDLTPVAGTPLIVVHSFLEESHPTIVARLVWTWRSPELLGYLKRLIVDDRGDRAGFSHEVMSELLLLHEILDTPQDIDKWNVNARAF